MTSEALELKDSRNTIFICNDFDFESRLNWGLDGYSRQRLRDDADRIKTPLVSAQRRKDALGKTSDFLDDDLITYLTRHVEQIFEPKRILTKNDWLNSYNEPDQFFDNYKKSRGNVIWMSPTKNKLYLFMIDNSICEEV